MIGEYTALIIDGNEESRIFLSELVYDADTLKEADYKDAYVSETAKNGILLNRKYKPCCILLGTSLPDMTAQATIEQLLRDTPTANIIVLAQEDCDDEAQRMIAAGAADYLAMNSLSLQLLHRNVRNIMLRARYRALNDASNNYTDALVHDLKHPLHSMFSLIRSLAESPNLSQHDKESICLMRQTANQMLNFTNNILYYSKLQEDSTINTTPCDLEEILQQVELNLLDQLENSSAQIHKGQLSRVQAHPVMLVQLLQNLISNAILYNTNDVPEITISCETNSVDDTTSITVSDNGAGINEKYLEQIFQPFKRLVGNNIEGNGLGLSICRKVAELHQGTIHCESDYGHGASFIITLPNSPTGKGKSSLEPIMYNDERTANILLVDDNPMDATLIKVKLLEIEKVKCNLHIVNSGEEALNWLNNRIFIHGTPKVDLILQDIYMPTMNGYEVCDAIRSNEKTRHIPICMVSTSDDCDDIKSAKKSGAIAYALKPLCLNQLEEILEQVPQLKLIPQNDFHHLCVEYDSQEACCQNSH